MGSLQVLRPALGLEGGNQVCLVGLVQARFSPCLWPKQASVPCLCFREYQNESWSFFLGAGCD